MYVVRRLTPIECARLQAFPDDWCEIGEWVEDKGKHVPMKKRFKKHKDADTPKYKAYGNSIALCSFYPTLLRMKPFLPENPTHGSLFSGIGGFDLLWASIYGIKNCIWSSEIEPFCIAVLKKHFGTGDDNGDVEKYV